MTVVLVVTQNIILSADSVRSKSAVKKFSVLFGILFVVSQQVFLTIWIKC